MTRKICVLVIFTCGILLSCQKTNESIFRKSIAKLKSIESIEYQIILDIKQKSVGLDEIDTAICFFDFKNTDTLFRPKYHIKAKYNESIYNGGLLFMVDNNEKRVIYTEKPRPEQINSSFFVFNSIYLIKKILPEFLTDPSTTISRQTDTVLNGEDNYRFKISVKDKAKYIKLGIQVNEEKWETPDFMLLISKKTLLPTQFINIFPDNGYWKSSFSIFNLSVTKPDSIWKYDRFNQNYLVISSKEFGERMRTAISLNIGQKAPDWLLPLVSEGSIQISNLKGSLVLLEFWFPYCDACVQAIPYINNIYDTYQQKNLKVYGIEFTRNDKIELDNYIKKQEIKYPTLIKGQEVAKNYGVNAAPTFFLIDKKGFIIYSSVGLNIQDLMTAINDNI